MTSTLIQNASAMLTGSPEPQAHTRATDLRIEGDRITEMGSLTPRAGETVVDARGCVVYPGFVNTHHHLFQSVLKGVPAGLNVPLFEWLQSVPYRYGPYLGEEAIEIAATIGIAELLLSGCTTVADHHYLYGTNMGYDPSATLFNVAERHAQCGDGAHHPVLFVHTRRAARDGAYRAQPGHSPAQPFV